MNLAVFCKIIRDITVLSQEKKKSTTKELKIVKWGPNEESYDIRKWKNGEPYKGISLSEDEAYRLYLALKSEFDNQFIKLEYDYEDDEDDEDENENEIASTIIEHDTIIDTFEFSSSEQRVLTEFGIELLDAVECAPIEKVKELLFSLRPELEQDEHDLFSGMSDCFQLDFGCSGDRKRIFIYGNDSLYLNEVASELVFAMDGKKFGDFDEIIDALQQEYSDKESIKTILSKKHEKEREHELLDSIFGGKDDLPF